MPFCPNCGTDIIDGRKFCTECGVELGERRAPPQMNYSTHRTAQPVVVQKDATAALLLALIPGLFGFLGIGHIYLGRVGLGIGLLIGGLCLMFIGWVTIYFIIGFFFWIAGAGLWVFQSWHAYDLAKKNNETLV